MMPSDANPYGFVYGGTILFLVDMVAGITAEKHARRNVVTASIDSMSFHSPVHVGNIIKLMSSVNYVGTTSMEVGVRIEAEDIREGTKTLTGSAYLTFVGLDEDGEPTEIPKVVPETPAEKRRYREAEERREERLKRLGRQQP